MEQDLDNRKVFGRNFIELILTSFWGEVVKYRVLIIM